MSDISKKSKIKQKKLFYKTLLEYLTSCKITDKENKDISHTSLGSRSLNVFSSKYKVKDECKDYFYQLYTEWVFKHDFPTFLTEKHHPDLSPVLIDLDFRYTKNESDRIKGEEEDTWQRKYKIEDIMTFLEKYFTLLEEVLDIKPYQKVAYVMEKSTPIYDSDKKTMKDGLHIMMPYIVSPYEPLFYIRNEILKDKELEKMFQTIGFNNDYSDIVDEAVIQRNNWFMYGSSKPGKEAYTITNVIKYSEVKQQLEATGKEVEKSNLELVKLLSVYDFDEYYICQVKDNTKFQTDLKKIEEKKNKPKMKKIMKNKTTEDLKVIHKLVSILSPTRADNHDDWMRVGWCLHNIDYTLLESWIEFSSQSSKADIQGTQHGRSKERCEKEWINMTNKGLELGSLHRWAKKDSPDEYLKIVREDLTNLIKASLNQTDYDIAKVIHKMLKHEFVCVSSKNKLWFQFKNHRWIEIDSAVELRRKISEDVVNEYCNLAILCNTQVTTTQDEDQRETLLKRGQIANKIALNLKKEGFKNNVVSACSTLFHDAKFLEKLDSNVNLIGFENGVYDLENKEFREGFPEDYISFSTKINYEKMNTREPIIQEVQEFLSQVLPIPRVKEYVLKILGSVLSGKTGQEKFHIWTGCHSKGTPIMKYNGLLIPVEYIKEGDELMGPDSQPRLVKKLVRGNSKMYKITPKKGESFKVNQDHILALKASKIGSIHNYNNNIIRVQSQERDELGYPVNKYQDFLYQSDTYYKTYYLAKNFQQKNYLTNKMIIRENDVIEIPVSEYIKRKNIMSNGNYQLFKVPISFPIQPVSDDPYYIGYNIIQNRYIPPEYKVNTKEVLLELLAGVVDRCGKYHKRGNNYEIYLPLEYLVDDIVFITRTLGFSAMKEVKTVNDITYYRMIFYGNDMDKIPVRLIRKKCKKRVIQKNPLHYDFKVESLEDDDYYGFTLNKDHLYVAGDFTVHHNCGGNGKSKIIELFELAFGDYCGKLSVTNVTQKRPASNACTPELLKNKGKRFVTLQEPDDDEQIHVGAMKELTGGDKIQARGLHKDPIEFKPQWKIVMTSNVLPNVSSNDNGTWRRLRVTEFISRFMEEKDMKPDKKYQFPIDYDLSTKLAMWPEAFMNILINSYHDFTKNGLKEPPEVLKNTEAYKEESDCMLQFINECLEESLSDKIKVTDAYGVFKEWFKNSGNTKKSPSKKDFQTNVSNSFGNPDSRNYWRGVTFVNQNEDDDDEEEDMD